MTHPLLKLHAEMCRDTRRMPFGPPANVATPIIEQLIEFAAAQHLIITVSTDTAAKRAELIKQRDALNEQLEQLK